jgi:hypothetical protein
MRKQNTINSILIILVLFVFTGEVWGEGNKYAGNSKSNTSINTFSCKLELYTSEQSYWFNKAILSNKFNRNSPNGTITSKKDSSICFYPVGKRLKGVYRFEDKSPLIKTELSYKQIMQTFGYLDALEKFLYDPPLSSPINELNKSVTIGKRIQEITGKEFKNKTDLRNWMEENRKYLIWEDSLGRLMLRGDLKIKKQPIFQDKAFPLLSKTYWANKINGWVFHEWHAGEYIKGVTWESETGSYTFKMLKKDEKEKRIQKEQFYLRRMKGVITSLNKSQNYTWIPYGLYLANNLTGLDFKNVNEVNDWYDNNSENLGLNSGGDKLIVLRK